MLMYEFRGITKRMQALAATALLLLLVGTFGVPAIEIKKIDNGVVLDEKVAAGIQFSSPLEAYRQGKAAFDEGWYGLALPALRYAADRGVFGAGPGPARQPD